MTSVEMKALLAKRMEDDSGIIFKPESVLYGALTNGIRAVTRYLRDEYLTDLEQTASGVSVSLGVVNVTAAVLGATPLRGGTSVKGVRIANGGAWLRGVKGKDLPKMQNPFFEGHVRDPWYYVWGNSVRVTPTNIRLVDVLFLSAPGPISATEEPVLDDDYHELIVIAGTEELWGSINNTKRADAAHKKLLQEAAILNGRLVEPKETGTEEEEIPKK